MKNVLSIVFNILRITFRKKGNIVIIFFLPIASVLLSIILYSDSGSTALKIGIQDEDKSYITQDFMDAIKKNRQIEIIDMSGSDSEAMVSDETVACVLRLDKGFSEKLYKGEPAQVKIITIKGKETTAFIENFSNLYISNLSNISKASGGDKKVFERIYSNSKDSELVLKTEEVENEYQGKLITVQSIGFLIMFLMFVSGTTAEYILREKRSRTYYRICTAPVNARTYILSNIIANITLLFVQILAALVIATKVFKVETYVPLYQLLLLLMLFSFVSIGLGMMVVSFAKDTLHSSTMMNLIVTPTCMLGGCMWPIEFTPEFMQKIGDFMPQRWVLSAVGKLQAGSGISGILTDLAVLLAFIIVLFVVVGYKFSKSDSVQNFV